MPFREGEGQAPPPRSFDIFAAEMMLSQRFDAPIAAQRLNRLAQVFQPWVDDKKRLALKEATDAHVCGLAFGIGQSSRKALDSYCK
jgi:hypothetical protein